METLQLHLTSPVIIKHPIHRLRQNELPFLRLSYNEVKRQKKLHMLPAHLPISNIQRLDRSPSVSPPEDQSVAAILFGNGSESQLCPLTRRRSAGAIPLGANYRLIDAVVSNCINSNITRICVLTQFNSTSLNSHLSRAYSNAGPGREGLLEVIAACQSPDNQSWFQGNADVVRRFLWMLEEYPVNEFLVLPGYHLYRMDYQEILNLHKETRADITISALCSEKKQDKGFGVLKVNSQGKVVELIQRVPVLLKVERLEDSEDYNSYSTFASMGIYVINKDIMIKLLREYLPWANDFESQVIPGAISLGMKVHAYQFDEYWENMGSIKAFYQANMEIKKMTDIRYNFFDRHSPLYSLPRCLPATQVTEAVISDSVIGDGCILNRCRIKGSVVGLRTRIQDGVVIEDSIIMGSDFYQEDLGHDNPHTKALVTPIGIGEGTVIRNAIVDKNARIGKGVMITNKDNIQEANREDQGYVIRDGILVIIRGAVISDGSIL